MEVDDDKTYASLISSSCNNNFEVINGGVRAHDTHMAVANGFRIAKEVEEDIGSIVYMATENNFFENDNKTIYSSLKSNFGSLHDGQYYPPEPNQFVNQLRVFIGDRMYLTTKFLVLLERVRLITANRNAVSNKPRLLSREDCMRKASRSIEIYNAQISHASKVYDFYYAIHPVPGGFNRSRTIESCVQRVLSEKGNSYKVKLLKLHDYFLETDPSFVNNPSMRFHRDGHYSEAGHLRVPRL